MWRAFNFSCVWLIIPGQKASMQSHSGADGNCAIESLAKGRKVCNSAHEEVSEVTLTLCLCCPCEKGGSSCSKLLLPWGVCVCPVPVGQGMEQGTWSCTWVPLSTFIFKMSLGGGIVVLFPLPTQAAGWSAPCGLCGAVLEAAECQRQCACLTSALLQRSRAC